VDLIQRCWSHQPEERPDFQQIYDDLCDFIIEGYIKDEWGRQFWSIHYPDQDSILWDDFIKNLMSSKVITLEDNTTYRGLAMSRKNPENRKIAECLQLLMSQIAGQRRSTFSRITCENFGKILVWFGPGVETDPKSAYTNFLERVGHICRQPWFFGLIYNPERILHDVERPVFMLRLSNDPGYFTIQTTQIKTRIVYAPGTGYKPENESTSFRDLVEFTNSKLKAYAPQAGSDFSLIWGTQTEQRGAYTPINTLIPNN